MRLDFNKNIIFICIINIKNMYKYEDKKRKFDWIDEWEFFY